MPSAPPQVIAMHGWSGVASNWDPWRQAFTTRGWHWQSGERGYGAATPQIPDWSDRGRRVVIAHSMGVHLLPAERLAEAEAVVLLASFGRFVPPGAPGRRLRSALEAMATQLQDAASAREMLRSFQREAAAPEPEELVPPGAAAGPLGEPQRQCLRDDLQRLGRTDGLPDGFPTGIPVLSVEAAQDRIVVPEARALLCHDLEDRGAEVHRLTLEDAGHCLLQPGVVGAVLQWLQPRVAP
ncbi:MAG: alpha/beta hydrolase [Cyanobium sp.]